MANIIKIEIDLDDLCSEYDSPQTVVELIKEDINFKIKTDFYKKFKQEIEESINNSIEKYVKLKAETIIESKILEIISNPEIKVRDLSIEEYVKEKILDNSSWNSLSKWIKDYSERAVKDIKNQYDLNFAMHIVKNMKDNNMLSETASKLLDDGK